MNELLSGYLYLILYIAFLLPGMDEKTMQIIGGWSDIATMRNVYTHVQQEDLRRAGEIISGMFQVISDR